MKGNTETLKSFALVFQDMKNVDDLKTASDLIFYVIFVFIIYQEHDRDTFFKKAQDSLCPIFLLM